LRLGAPATRTRIVCGTALSFPSAHAATSFAGAVSYSRLGLPAIPLYALATALSASRLYLGVHFPSDTLAGALLGTALGRRFARTVHDSAHELDSAREPQ